MFPDDKSREDYKKAIEKSYPHEFKREERRRNIYLVFKTACKDCMEYKSMFNAFTKIQMPEKSKIWIERMEELLGIEMTGEKIKAFVAFSKNYDWPNFVKFANEVVNSGYSLLDANIQKVFLQYSGYIMVWQHWILNLEERMILDPVSMIGKVQLVHSDDTVWKVSPVLTAYLSQMEDDLTKFLE